jgi:hypothetical protein
MNLFKRCKLLVATFLVMGLLLTASMVYAQQTTEQFIPIGMSPGISDKFSYIGSIIAVDRATNTFTLQSNRGRKTITVSPLTHIWLDKSKIKQANVKASFDDFEVGRRIEVMHKRDNDKVAEWIKIESS